MIPHLILIGKSASGKDVFAGYVAEKYHIPSIRFSTIITEIGREYGWVGKQEEVTKAQKQEIGTRLRREYGAKIYTERIARQVQGKTHTLNGVRHPDEIECLRKHFGDNLMLIGIVVDTEKRYERMLKNGKAKSYVQFQDLEAHAAEEKVDELLEQCDVSLENNGEQAEFYEKIDHLLAKLQKTGT